MGIANMSGDTRKQNSHIFGHMQCSATRQRKESRQINMSVEGKNCEALYFKHLAELINTSNKNKYNLALSVRRASPKDYAKRYYQPIDTKNGKQIPFFHIQDVEDYNDKQLAHKFCSIIDEIAEVKSTLGIVYKLGYSNYTFDLWILLHVADMKASVNHRNQYLTPINNYLRENKENKFKDLDEYKRKKNFANILKKYITLDKVFQAIRRAETIVDDNRRKYHITGHRDIRFYKENPDTSVHEIVKLIFNICGVNIPAT